MLVTTSNFAPDDLCRRSATRTVPARIALIKENARRRSKSMPASTTGCATLEHVEALPHAGRTPSAAEEAFAHANAMRGGARRGSEVGRRPDDPRRAARRGVVWFDFGALCDGPRAKADYLELARRFAGVRLRHPALRSRGCGRRAASRGWSTSCTIVA